jgi:hypothetical protein
LAHADIAAYLRVDVAQLELDLAARVQADYEIDKVVRHAELT